MKLTAWTKNRIILKIILNLWTVVTIFIFFFNFFDGGSLDQLSNCVGIVYLAILGIYVGEKEYIRWKTTFVSRFIGESFIAIWTIIMIFFVIMSVFSHGYYRVPTEFGVVYTSVVAAFVITQNSKNLHKKRIHRSRLVKD